MKEELQKLLDGALEQIKIQAELYAEKVINEKSDEAVERAIQKLEEAAKGNALVVAVLESAKGKIKEEMKKALLGLAEKISDKV